MAARKKNEVAKLAPVSKRILALSTAARGESDAAEWNHGNDPQAVAGIKWTDFDRIRTMAGGATGFEVVSMITGEAESVKELRFQPVFLKHGRSLYLTYMGEGDSPAPDCSSADGINGYGKIALDGEPCKRSCATCPMAQFGTMEHIGKKGGGQACSQIMLLFGYVLDENGCSSEEMPAVIKIPPTSVRTMRKFIMRLSVKRLPYWAVWLKILTQKAMSAGNKPYSKLVVEVGGALSQEDRESVRPAAVSMRDMLGTASAADLNSDLAGRERVVQAEVVEEVAPGGGDYPGADDEFVDAELVEEEIPF